MTTISPTINNWSASQITAFNNCKRLWFQRWIMKKRGPESPAQIRGKEIHSILENYLTSGHLNEDHPLGYHRYIEWLKPLLPDPSEEHMAIEQKILLDTPSGLPIIGDVEVKGIPLIGYIDLGLWGRDIPVIGDLKTTSSLRYAKTPAELNLDVQMNTYARWVFGVARGLDIVEVGHWYVKVEGPGKPAPKRIRSTKTLPVFTTITRSGNEECWQREVEVMKDMTKTSLALSFHDIDPNINSCQNYGGCDFREDCGISVQQTLKNKSKGKTNMSFLDKIKGAAATNGQSAPAIPATVPVVAAAAPAAPVAFSFKGAVPVTPVAPVAAAPVAPVAAAPVVPVAAAPVVPVAAAPVVPVAAAPVVPVAAAPVAPVAAAPVAPVAAAPVAPVAAAPAAVTAVAVAPAAATGLLPPDSPPRATSSAESEGIRAAAAAKLEKKEAAAAKRAAKKPSVKKRKRELTLYIGCYPTKGEHQSAIMVEDWMAEPIAELNAQLLAAYPDKPDFRLLGYAEEKVALTQTISAKLAEGDLPKAMVCLTSHGTAREVINMLMPHATDIVSTVQK